MAMRMIGVFFMFGSIIALLILMDSPLVAPQTILATIFRWHPYHKAYETMILGMYAVLGIHLWNAASDPVTHRSLINFTIWVNWVHAGIMVAFASTREHEWGHLLGDVLILGLAATILMWLRRPSISLQCDASGRRK